MAKGRERADRGRRWVLPLALAALAGLGVGGCEGQEPGLTADRLGVMIDSLLPGIAEASGMPARSEVRYALQSRADARSFIEAQLDEELGTGDLQGMERAYRAWGLLPDTVSLRALMLELLTEQVVGYYDPATSRLYVVEGVPAATAAPVVAHELVHALQDQHADLEALVAPERGNDRQMAAHAAAEGQAMLVMLALQAAQMTGQTIDPGALPDLGPMLRPAMEAENSQFPVFQRSPRLIRETLLFPYIGGAAFVQALFRARKGGKAPVPFGDLLPQSTEQVLDPEGAFLGERDDPTELALGPVGGGWSVVYENTLGQLELGILMSERLGAGSGGEAGGDGGAVARGWDGDRYQLLEGPDGAGALVWVAVFDDGAAADRFAGAYRRWSEGVAPGVAPGYGPGLVERVEVGGRPAVRVVEASGVEPGAVPFPAARVR